MCGIFGIIHFNEEPASPGLLERMGSRMIHRGPDDAGYLTHGSVGIGMRRLSIIDLSGGHQPISNETGDIHIVLNGEIYNYREQRSELIGRGHQFSTHSDVEVVLHLYEEMGEACVERLNGMFAFAIFDQQKDLLWIARDRLGIKPLYYRRLANGLAFASDLGSLLEVAQAELDRESLVTYLGYSYVPEPRTVYQDIYKLECASHMRIQNGHVEMSRYWYPDSGPQLDLTVDEAADRLDELLLEAADLQLRSDVPVGIFLSGGVDSSAVAALAAKVNGAEAVNTFTIDFLGKGGEDATYANLVAEHIGAHHRTISIDVDQQITAFDELVTRMDEPMSDSAIVPTYILSREARDRGVKVLLSGAGGDEIFGGYSRHFPGRIGSAAWIAHNPLARSVMRLVTARSRPHWRRRFANPARNFAVMVSGANLEFLHQTLCEPGQFDRLMDSMDQDFAAARERDELKRMRLDLDDYLPNNVLALTDKATMAPSVEGRVPLLDHRIVEFAYALPGHINLLGGKDKGLFKKVLSRYVPEPVLTRGKEGFNAPMTKWAVKLSQQVDQEIDDLHPLLRDMLNQDVVKSWGLAPRDRRFVGESLYAIYTLSRWLKSHA